MGTTDFGTQTISFDFREPGKSENFNKLNYKILETGIYEGGLLSYVDATHISVAPFLAYLQDSDTELSVRVETENSIDLLVAPSAPYCVIRFNWANVTNNFADVIMVAEVDIDADDLILGRVVYDVTTLETFFDYSRKHVPVITTEIAKKSEFAVLPQEPYDNTVYITGGTINNGAESITIASGNSPTISDTTLGRIDIVYLTAAGAFDVLEGIDSASPVTPYYGDGQILCEIHRGAGKTYITGADIILVTEDRFLESQLTKDTTLTIPATLANSPSELVKIGDSVPRDLNGYTLNVVMETATFDIKDWGFVLNGFRNGNLHITGTGISGGVPSTELLGNGYEAGLGFNNLVNVHIEVELLQFVSCNLAWNNNTGSTLKITDTTGFDMVNVPGFYMMDITGCELLDLSFVTLFASGTGVASHIMLLDSVDKVVGLPVFNTEAIPGIFDSTSFTYYGEFIDTIFLDTTGMVTGVTGIEDVTSHDYVYLDQLGLYADITDLAADITDLAGAGRTTETVKQNADDIVSEIADLAGAGRTTETVKQNADDIASNFVTHTRREALSRSIAALRGQASVFKDTGAVDVRFAWANNLANAIWNDPDATGNLGKASVNTGGFWGFVERAAGVYFLVPPVSSFYQHGSDPAAVSGDLIVNACFSDNGQYGVVYIERSGTTRFSKTSDYGYTWSAYASTTGTTKVNNTEISIVWNNGYFYVSDSTNDYFWRATEANPGTFTRITCGSDVGTGGSRVMKTNGQVFLVKTVLTGGDDTRYCTPMSTDTVAGTTRSFTRASIVQSTPGYAIYKPTGVDPGYYFLYPGNGPDFEDLMYMPTDLSSYTLEDSGKAGIQPTSFSNSALIDGDLNCTVVVGTAGIMILDGPIIRDSEITEIRYKVSPFVGTTSTYAYSVAFAVKEDTGELSTQAIAYVVTADTGRFLCTMVNDEAVAIARGEVVLLEP